ncbi:hypothetical protein KM043_010674 [Ampulex compressa]|nr:hypothetical protein KM043_010674 [Ampulex compressa]
MEAAHKQATESTTQSQSNGTNVQNGEHVNETFPQEEESISAENQNNENICKENNSEDKEERVIDSGAMNGEPEKIPNRKEKKKSKKRGLSESMEESEEQPVSKRKIKNVSVLSKANENEVTSNTPTFKWKEVIVNIVQNKGEISLKKLQKKVVSQYMAYCSDILTHEKAVNKFNKKLKKIPGIEVSEERVRIM